MCVKWQWLVQKNASYIVKNDLMTQSRQGLDIISFSVVFIAGLLYCIAVDKMFLLFSPCFNWCWRVDYSWWRSQVAVQNNLLSQINSELQKALAQCVFFTSKTQKASHIGYIILSLSNVPSRFTCIKLSSCSWEITVVSLSSLFFIWKKWKH